MLNLFESEDEKLSVILSDKELNYASVNLNKSFPFYIFYC